MEQAIQENNKKNKWLFLGLCKVWYKNKKRTQYIAVGKNIGLIKFGQGI